MTTLQTYTLLPINSPEDIPLALRQTPFETLIRYHNFHEGSEEDSMETPQLLVSMCMDHRKKLRVPENFAYILRSGGGNVRHNEFKLAYAISIGKIFHVALIGHTNCGMVSLHSRKDLFIQGLSEVAGWTPEDASIYFDQFAPFFEIGDPVSFTAKEASRLQNAYPGVHFSPFLYDIDKGILSAIQGH